MDAIRKAVQMARDAVTDYPNATSDDLAAVGAAEAALAEMEGRMKDREGLALRIYGAMWFDADRPAKNWDACSETQKVFWRKAAENAVAHILSQPSEDPTRVEIVLEAAKADGERARKGEDLRHGLVMLDIARVGLSIAAAKNEGLEVAARMCANSGLGNMAKVIRAAMEDLTPLHQRLPAPEPRG